MRNKDGLNVAEGKEKKQKYSRKFRKREESKWLSHLSYCDWGDNDSLAGVRDVWGEGEWWVWKSPWDINK